MAATEKSRSASLAERKTKAGLVKVSCSKWVPKKYADKARDAMSKAGDKYVTPWLKENLK